ncbi:hypothetical protein EW146_g4705 [Bondarzewia mesenterica]|uniref:Uncharacterized protein n=1 Tax=Bondarzewia mesenterica TaxID=1095465 RepID=A0A4V3XF17_9AGAM|nr:hypothetical protein EW146_g4705 [Bondarzewia mesenterica]
MLEFVKQEKEEQVAAEKVREQEAQITAVKAKESERAKHRKISAEKVEWNSENELMSVNILSIGDADVDMEMMALTSETGGDVSAVSDMGKGKGHLKKWKPVEVTGMIPEGAVPVNKMCYRCMTEFSAPYMCYQILGMDKCMNSVSVIKIKLAKNKASSSSAPHPKPVTRSSESSTTTTTQFLKKSVAECEKLVSKVAVSVESGMSLPSLINAEDMITWHLESNARELAIILGEHESDKHELEKVRCEIHAAKRELGMKDDQ